MSGNNQRLRFSRRLAGAMLAVVALFPTVCQAADGSMHAHLPSGHASLQPPRPPAAHEKSVENPNANVARMMMKDARQWAQRGWKQAAIQLAQRAGRMESRWPEGESPREFIELLSGRKRPAPTPQPSTKAERVVVLPADFLELEQPAKAADVQQVSFVDVRELSTPIPIRRRSGGGASASVQTARSDEPKSIAKPPESSAGAVTSVAQPSPPEIRVIIGESLRPAPPSSEATSAAAATTRSPDRDPSQTSAPPAVVAQVGNSPTWQTIALMLFAALAMMLLRDARLPGRLQIQVTNPEQPQATSSPSPSKPTQSLLRRRS